MWQVFMVSADAELNVATLKNILGSGHSRVPVHASNSRQAFSAYGACIFRVAEAFLLPCRGHLPHVPPEEQAVYENQALPP